MKDDHLDPVEIARREERRTARALTEIAAEWEPIAGGTMGFGGLGSWVNFAVGLGLDGPVGGDDLDRSIRFYADRGVEALVEVSPFAHKSLVRGLADRGFVLREFETVLARAIEATEDFRPKTWPRGLEIVQVDPGDDEQVRAFIDVSLSGFRAAGHPLDPVNEEYARRVVEHPKTRCFLALVEGSPAGGGSLDVGEDIACLFGTSVLPAYRRRGIQQALILRRLERCREEGRHLAAVHSTPGAATDRNAMRLGFSLAYTKVGLALPWSNRA